ncbi:MAG: malonyl-CoA synthase [Hyphomicrobiales bacterium]|nr:MAG: malonyl-CoA synthase [Hyphomicrobiales bacterium]
MNEANHNLFCHLISPDESRTAISLPTGEEISYAELDAMSARYANALKNHGLQKGDRLMAQTEKSHHAVALYLATIRLGAIYVTINSAYTAAEAAYFVGDATPKIFVCDPSRIEETNIFCTPTNSLVVSLSPNGDGSLDLEALNQSENFKTELCTSQDLAAILYTSGTTGKSKGAMLTHGNLLSNAQTLYKVWGYAKDDVLIHALPIFHTHGLFVALNLSFLAKAKVILLTKFDSQLIIKLMPTATVLMGVPTFYTRLLNEAGLNQSICTNMRLFVSGSAPLLASTHQQWQQITGHAILERYGMTETNMNTSNPLNGERRPGTVGMALPGTELRIAVKTTTELMPTGEIGMLQVRGPNVFVGYWNMPEKTAAEFTSDGFFITGDLGLIDKDGYIHIIGRDKDMVISGGFNIYPKEIETELDAMQHILESAVFGVDDADFGEKVIAAIILEQGCEENRQAIDSHMTNRLARFKRPAEIYFIENLPRNTMGKVQKNILRQEFLTNSQS